MSSDLVSRVLAAIEETERLARACEGRQWTTRFGPAPDGEEPEHWVMGVPTCETVAICGEDYTMARHDAAHISHNDPAAVLRRCAEDRRLVEWYQGWQETFRGPIPEGHSEESALHFRMASEYVFTRIQAAYGLSVEEETTVSEQTCGATTVFWPDDEACDAVCFLPIGHEPADVHEDESLGRWSEDELMTSGGVNDE